MAFPNLDKCSCGSPRSMKIMDFGTLERTLGKQDSLKKKVENCDRREWCGTARNDYTKPNSCERKSSLTTAVGQGQGLSRDGQCQGRDGQCQGRDGETEKNARNNFLKREAMLLRQGSGKMSRDADAGRSTTGCNMDEEMKARLVKSVTLPRKAINSDSNSDYTSLAYDINYVKVSPPKMTRRPKKSDDLTDAEATVKSQPRAAQLARDRMSSAEESSLEKRSRRELAPPDVTTIDHVTTADHAKTIGLEDKYQTSKDMKVPNTDSRNSDSTSGLERKETVDGILTSTESNKDRSDDTKTSTKRPSDYVPWEDMKTKFTNPATDKIDPTPVERKQQRNQTAEPTEEVNTGHKNKLSDKSDSTDSSVLQLTFTVRLENETLMRNGGTVSEGHVKFGRDFSPVVSGTVDIKSDKSVPSTGSVKVLQPVIRVGLQNGTVAQASPAIERKTEESVNAWIRREVDSKNTEQHRTPTKYEKLNDESRSRDARFAASDGFKTVSWSDRSTKNQINSEIEPEMTKYSTTGKASSKRQTLADFLSHQKTKITTVAIVHKPADFDEDRERESRSVTEKQRNRKSDEDSSWKENYDVSSETMRRPAHHSTASYNEIEELTHMNWDEVMQEAESLGIPLQRPAAVRDDRHRPSITDNLQSYQPPAALVGTPASFICPFCADLRRSTPAEKLASATTTKKGSPFKDKFKFSNLFGGKKQKEEEEQKLRAQQQQQQQQLSSRQHLLQQHFVNGNCQTLPMGARLATQTDEFCCQRCCSVGTGNKTSRAAPSSGDVVDGRLSLLSPIRLQKKKAYSAGRKEKEVDQHQRVNYLCSPPSQLRYPRIQDAIMATLPKRSTPDVFSTLTSKANERQDFLKSLDQLKHCGWYWGKLGFEDAELKLTNRPDGSFLVRDSSDDHYILSVSFRSQGTTHHTRIEHHRGLFSFYSHQSPHEASSIVDFIEDAICRSQNGQCLYYLRARLPTLPPAPVRLLYPVSRFRVPSLETFCRATVLRLVRPEHIDRLPVSPAMKEYLKK